MVGGHSIISDWTNFISSFSLFCRNSHVFPGLLEKIHPVACFTPVDILGSLVSALEIIKLLVFVLGYVIYSVRKKLKKQYIHLKCKQIEKLKKSDVEITDIILSPEVAFTGDTTLDYMLDPRNADALRAKILITEATFLDEGYSIKHAREHGHSHIFEIMEHAQWIRQQGCPINSFLVPLQHRGDRSIKLLVSVLVPLTQQIPLNLY
ncbi:hypothetical protein SLEP1_g39526 [Rubroshorea leprosula]|uniref:Uncharacterized protein n=1 Tax=Rubroshorea leprosula TaxID=152421 RepID=A0AAV5L1A6_9ROSI|nr:hypothetical protein SLEP1_g39526 [Rubroshorea leprosula]